MNHLIDNLPELPIHGLNIDARPFLKNTTLSPEIKTKIISQSTPSAITAALTKDPILINDLATSNINISAFIPPIDKAILNTCLLHCREIPTITYLLTHGADINTTNNIGQPLLIVTCSINNTRLTAHILALSPTTIDHQDNNGETALFRAISEHSLPLIDLLLNNNANPNIKNNIGQTPLHKAAAKSNCTEMIKLLLIAGADPTATDNDNNKFTHHLTRSEADEINNFIINENARIKSFQQEIASLRTNLTAKPNSLKAMII